MNADKRFETDRVIREQNQHPFVTGFGPIAFFGCLLSICLTGACTVAPKVGYLTGAQIQESIIGESLAGAGPALWKEQYLPIDNERREGEIKGRSNSGPPYGGTWSIVGDRMCVVYPRNPDASGCSRLARGKGNKILWFDETGVLEDESELIETGQTGDLPSEMARQTFRQETVTFQHGENMLVGDFRLPAGPAPYPAVVFVHGSGPATRHSYYFESVGNEFLSRGFATLIWSKPGVDESTGSYLKQSMALRAEEVAAAMTHLAKRTDIAGDRIGLWGISQAGWVMPMVPTHRNVAFVIVVSGSGQSGQEQDLYIVKNEMTKIGTSESDRADAVGHRRAFFDLIRDSADYEEFRPRYEKWLKEMKLRSWYPTVERSLDKLLSYELVLSIERRDFDFFAINLANDANRTLIPPPQLKNLDMPVLAIYGTEDPIVDSKLGSKAYENISRDVGNPDVTVKLFEGAGHGIMHPDSDGYLYFAPDYLATMGDWLAARR
jgi:hypothetical protein